MGCKDRYLCGYSGPLLECHTLCGIWWLNRNLSCWKQRFVCAIEILSNPCALMFLKLTYSVDVLSHNIMDFYLSPRTLTSCTFFWRIANVWDIRAGRQMHKLLGHNGWVRWVKVLLTFTWCNMYLYIIWALEAWIPLRRSIRMVGDVVITGSDDWTARMWSVSRGTCDAVLACHAGPVLCVEYSVSDRGIVTGKEYSLSGYSLSDNYASEVQGQCIICNS